MLFFFSVLHCSNHFLPLSGWLALFVAAFEPKNVLMQRVFCLILVGFILFLLFHSLVSSSQLRLSLNTTLCALFQAQLRAFIPEMLKYSTGRGKPGWGKESCKPIWWPEDIPWANVRSDVRTEEQKQRVGSPRVCLPSVFVVCFCFPVLAASSAHLCGLLKQPKTSQLSKYAVNLLQSLFRGLVKPLKGSCPILRDLCA